MRTFLRRRRNFWKVFEDLSVPLIFRILEQEGEDSWSDTSWSLLWHDELLITRPRSCTSWSTQVSFLGLFQVLYKNHPHCTSKAWLHYEPCTISLILYLLYLICILRLNISIHYYGFQHDELLITRPRSCTSWSIQVSFLGLCQVCTRTIHIVQAKPGCITNHVQFH